MKHPQDRPQRLALGLVGVCLALSSARGQAPAGAPAFLQSPANTSGLALRGTLVLSDPARSLAMVEVGPGDFRTLRVGTEIPGMGRLAKVESRGIYVEQGGATFYFSFNDSAPSAARPPAAQVAAEGGGSNAAAANMAVYESATAQTSARVYVVPDVGQRGGGDVEEARFDATPKPGQTIDTTDWDAIRRQKSAR